MKINFQFFAEAGNMVVTTTGSVVDAYSGNQVGAVTVSGANKEFYANELLENARPNLVLTQLGQHMVLPKHHGKTVEWRKLSTFAPPESALQEGVIPTSSTFEMETITAQLQQFGDYTTISDQLEMHAVDPLVLGLAEEMGAAAGSTAEGVVRAALAGSTNMYFAPDSAGNLPMELDSILPENKITMDLVHQIVTTLKRNKAPKFDGRWYVAVIHPCVAYDLTRCDEWIEAHKYAATTELFTGEIGCIRGVRFIESTEVPVINNYTTNVFLTVFMGKNAFAVVDPEGMGLEMIIKDKSQAGGPLDQFSTVGYKFETAAAILYPERLVCLASAATNGDKETANL